MSTRPGVPTPIPRGVEDDSGKELVDQAEDELEGVVAVAAVDRQLDDAADLAAEVDEGAGEDALAEVEADDLAGVADDAEEDRALATGRRAAADFLDHAVVEQLADDVADGGPRQAGAAGDLGAADRPEVIDGPKHEALVVLARLGVGRLGRESHPLEVPRSLHRGLAAREDFANGIDKAQDARSRRQCQESGQSRYRPDRRTPDGRDRSADQIGTAMHDRYPETTSGRSIDGRHAWLSKSIGHADHAASCSEREARA